MTMKLRRRRFLQGISSITAATAMLAIRSHPADAQQVKWSTGTEPAKLRAPANAADCHHHIYDARYPADPTAVLHPGDALVEDYRALQRRIGTKRHVIVQPSTYGTDNRITFDALAAFGAEARAVAVVNDSVSDAELKRMNELGVRGIRFNLAQAGATTPEMIEPLSNRVNELGWHIQINANAITTMAIMDILNRVSSPIVFDHLGHLPEPAGIGDPLFGRIRALIDKGKTWVKLSGAYADTKVGPPSYSDSSAVARAYVLAAPERLIWGSDWPHPSERVKPDDALLFDLLADWAPDDAVRNRILVQNAEALYGFPKTA
jgi:D-galactarolactone isomerase